MSVLSLVRFDPDGKAIYVEAQPGVPLPREVAPVTDAKADRLKAWLNVAMNRVHASQVADTDVYAAKVKGLRQCVGTGSTEALAISDLEGKLTSWAEHRLTGGEELPFFDRPMVVVPAEIVRCIRLSTLRKLVIARAGQWGVVRRKLPPHALDPLLADIDQLITRHAAQMNGTH